VPALAGLLTPQWNTECSGAFLGLKMNTERSHLIKSVIDAIAFQNRKVFELMQQHCAIDQLIVDGGLSNSLVMMQTQSDVLGLPIVRPQQKEATVFGAARAAAIGAGIQEWPQIAGQEERPDVFQPTRDARNDTQYSDWEAAVDMICNQGEKSSDR
jgi:glycerol kinase